MIALLFVESEAVEIAAEFVLILSELLLMDLSLELMLDALLEMALKFKFELTLLSLIFFSF